MDRITALSEAIKAFSEENPAEMAERWGGRFDQSSQTIFLKYFSTEVAITWPTGHIKCDSLSLNNNDKVIILQFLISTCTISPRGQWISFIQLPDGPHHHEPFVNEAIRPLAVEFGENITSFRSIAEKFGAFKVNLGDAGLVIPVLPSLPIAAVIWAGDEEFPANANILFDSTAPLHLTTAALWVLGVEVSRKLRSVEGQQYS